MDYLSHIYLPGAVALWSALIFALTTMVGYVLALSGDASGISFARRSYSFFALSIFLTAFVLISLLMARDFRVEYVYQYSGMDLPWFYQFAAFWAGQKGSFMIWLFWGTMLGLLVRRTTGKSEPAVMGIYTLTLLGLLLILVRENPFLMLRQTPVDGQGLNPLLQDNWMVIHPPIMFIGYAASAIPFSFAMAALWRRKYDGWAARAFPWALGGFLVLGTAILMGGYWAYKTLGWGGYWGWDPVENASFIPWLFGTVLIHGLYMERTKGRFRRANYVFTFLTYISVLYGTFLTRSGVLADFSVHSFVDLGISGWLTFLLGGFMLLGLYLIVTRWKEIPTVPSEDPSFLSRGTFLVMGSITILIAALVITAGTSAPLLTRFMESQSQVGPSFYNRVNLPIAMLVAFLLSFVPYLTWKETPGNVLLRKMALPIAFSVIVTVAAAVWRVRDVFHLVFILLAALALATNLQKTIDKYRAGGFKAMGGYLTHVGVGIILLGIIASSGYDQSTKVTLTQGAPKQVDDMTLTFKRFIPRQGREKERMEIEVARAGRSPFMVYPKLFVNDRTRQTMVNPDIKSSPFQDLYVSPIEFDPGQPRLELAQGQSGQIGDMQIHFVRFNLNMDGNAVAALNAGHSTTVGAELAITNKEGKTFSVTPVYRLNPATGTVETPPTALPGGGTITMAGINTGSHAVQLETTGLAAPMKLSIDVTRKPLIQLVWGGLYVVLLGGILTMIQRFRQARVLEQIAG
ncbi:MAG TPA: cytochrome c-type biogenesis CcmF C-terminal domain-containing protein [Thermoanaerobaculia bacterium]